MKKVLYMLFIGMLIMIPFGVFAEGEEGIGMMCSGSALYTQGNNSIKCEVTYYGPTIEGIKPDLGTNDGDAINIGDAATRESSLFPNKSPKVSKFYNITLTDAGRALTDDKTVTVTASANGKAEEKTINIVVGTESTEEEQEEPAEQEKSTIPSKNSTETKQATLTTSETANPDTADLNVVQLATLSIVFLAILLLSFKKVVKNN